MKKIRTIDFKIVGCLVFLLFCSGCSLFSTKRKSIDEQQSKQNQETVSKEEFDELKSKYEALLAKTGGKMENDQYDQGDQADQAEKNKELKEVIPPLPTPNDNNRNLSEIVTLGEEDKGNLKQQKIEDAILASMEIVPDEKEVEKESRLFKMALASYNKKEHEKSLKMFQNLEKSDFPQIKVRSKFYIAEILFIQKEFDLAMQIYEEIIHDYAFSGLSLYSLERLSVCAKELNLEDKRNKYQAMIDGLLGRKT